MSRIPRVTARQAEKVVRKLGFVLARQSGSHRIYKNAARLRVTISFHSGKILHPKIVQSIIDDARITPEEFERLLKE
jgi:predicted RNA binding protein YcfA (HicA-like mRNA interferase family)